MAQQSCPSCGKKYVGVGGEDARKPVILPCMCVICKGCALAEEAKVQEEAEKGRDICNVQRHLQIVDLTQRRDSSSNTKPATADGRNPVRFRVSFPLLIFTLRPICVCFSCMLPTKVTRSVVPAAVAAMHQGHQRSIKQCVKV